MKQTEWFDPEKILPPENKMVQLDILIGFNYHMHISGKYINKEWLSCSHIKDFKVLKWSYYV